MRWSPNAYIQAYRFAARAHVGQTMPGTDIPYLMHLSFVSMEIIAALRAEEGRDESVAVQCSLLHDTLEDTPTTFAELEREFGRNVANGVAALTKDAAIVKELRMADSLRRIKEQPREIWMVKLADRITNLQPPPEHWTPDKVARYKAEGVEIHDALSGASALLATRLLERLAVYGS